MNRELILSVLYDLTLTIGGEVQLDPLLTKVLQRLLFHTGFPAGAVLLDREPGEPLAAARVATVVGDHLLTQRRGRRVELPAPLLQGPIELIGDPALLAPLAGSQIYRYCLRLPVEGDATILLLSPEPPATKLPITQLFRPVLANLAKAILLCRNTEQLTRSLMSDRARAREDLAAALAQSEQERAILKSLKDTLPDLVWLKDIDGIYLACNPRFEAFFGAKEAEILGKSDYDFVDRGLADFFRDHDRMAMEAGAPTVNLEWITFAEDGHRALVETIKTPMRDAQGRLIGVLGIGRDITARHTAEQEVLRYRDHLEELVGIRTAQLEQAKEAAEAANRAKSVFLSNMSHELRTPLNAILGFSQMVVGNPSICAEQARAMQSINRAGQHLLQLINDVLEISRIEAGRNRVQAAPFDLRETLDATEEMIRVRTSAKGLAFEVARGAGLPRYLLGDAHHLRQVLINLLGNAAKYTDRGGVALRVEPVEGGVHFEVADTGPGIPPEEQEKIFQPFYQTADGIAKGEGTGLGLAISREFVQLMGGELRVQSAPGQGSRFDFTLPLPISDAPATPPGELPGRVIGLAPEQPVWRILVVEDDPEGREALILLLRRVGFQVAEAKDGQQAIALFQSWHPQMLWMDIRMPVMDGLEATRRIRALPGGGEVKIVALTASAFDEERAAIVAAGCDDVAIKPFIEEKILAAMQRMLGLEYIYETPESAPSARGVDLSPLPGPLLARLREAAEALDSEGVNAILEEIRAGQPGIAQSLARLADEFRFDLLANLCQR